MPNDLHVKSVLNRRFKREIKNGNWSKIAKKLGVNRGLLWRVYHGKTKSNKIRVALGMPCLAIEVRPCPCGGVHDHQCEKGKGILRRAKSSNPQTLKFVQETIIPFLLEKMK